ncbi:MAG: PKD domain-containing protein [Bacteroidia bacterium]|nr:PKD domain-containing protein [Bacteroidia bacterium]
MKTFTIIVIVLLSWTNIAKVFSQPVGFVDQVYSTGFTNAIGITFDANGRMYVSEKGGKVWIVENGIKSASPLLDISEEVGNWRDFGLLGVALDPAFLSNGYIYLLYTVDAHHLLNYGTPSYNAATDQYYDATIGRITRYTAESASNFTTVDYNSRLILVGDSAHNGFPSLHQSHHVGSLVFGTDGTLMAACGDAASYEQVDQGGQVSGGWVNNGLTYGIITAAQNIGAYRSQDTTCQDGKILRINPANGDAIPSNPFYDPAHPRSPKSRMWAMGLRNPYRMSLRPETGSHNPTHGNPGTLYIGDVGWNSAEELNVCDEPGLNFGWPKWEGMTHQPGYNNATYAPAVHTRPKLDWRGGTARGSVNGTIYNIGSSQIPGPNFTGNCATGGVWYTGNDYPAEYKNTYFLADYGGQWIRNVTFDANNNPTVVKDFLSSGGAITAVNSSPIEGSLFYVNNGSSVRVIRYSPSNQPPKAIIRSDIIYGTSPLTIPLRGDRSYDPENQPLTYTWDFGDGSPAGTQMNPVHTFNSGNSTPTSYMVILTVEDDQMVTAKDTLIVSLNNTPPQIVSTSVDNLDYFSGNVNQPLSAVVNDAEQSGAGLSYSWQVSLFHGNHHHPEPLDTNPSTTTILTPVGCDGILYFFRVELTVTDNAGLSDYYFKDIYPNCPGMEELPVAAFIAKNNPLLPMSFDFDASGSYDVNGPIQSYSWDFGDGNTGVGMTPSHVYYTSGNYTVTLTVTDSAGSTDDFSKVASVYCGNSAPEGFITFETWTGISGTNLSAVNWSSAPSSSSTLNIAQIPTDVANNYGSRIRGYIHAPETGAFIFWISSDDEGALYLSTDEDSTNMSLIASVPDWTSSLEWDKYPQQQSIAQNLIAGRKYYIEARMKEGGGGDNLAIGWQLPSGGQERPVPGNRLSSIANGGPVIADCGTCGSIAATDIALRGEYGACESVFNNAILEIQDEYEDALIGINDNNQDLGQVRVSTFDHGFSAGVFNNNFPFSNRSFYISTEKTPSANVNVELYITPEEFDALAAASIYVSSLGDLRIAKFSGGIPGVPGIGTPSVIIPSAASAGTGPGGSHVITFQTASFSTFYLTGPDTYFPVEWLDFSAIQQGDDAKLTWATANETNSSHFVIERSDDATNYEQIGITRAAGNSSKVLEYNYIDPMITRQSSSHLFYRLRQVDLDGSFDYSKVEEVVLRFSNTQLSLFPNPATDAFTVLVEAEKPAAARIQVMSLEGKQVIDYQWQPKEVREKTEIQTRGWAMGIYFVRMSCGSTVSTVKLVVE